ncbi:MAG: hypothetical protein K2M42_05455 [Oscillospiraceae bacterium]|nr:hypothetical protein [Oscillospiraceae bacterium]
MTDAMEVLFNYAQEWLEKPLLLAEPEYESVLRRVDSQEQRLQALLSDEGKELLDHLISERNFLLSFHQQAMFRAGFQLALELGR